MKHLVTMTACLLVLMALLSQFVQNQKLLLQLEQGSHMVDVFCEDENEERLRSSLADVMGCREEDIHLQKEPDKVKVAVPVAPILATPSFWGISPEENKGIYQWERTVSDG